jgi:hypothetical protein
VWESTIGALLILLFSPNHIHKQMLFPVRKAAVADEAAVVEAGFLVRPKSSTFSNNVKYSLTFF